MIIPEIPGVYMIRSIKNSKRYIGSSINLRDRKNQHFLDLNDRRHCNRHLQQHYNKYGVEDLVFNIVEFVLRDQTESDEEFRDRLVKGREQYWIDTLHLFSEKGIPLEFNLSPIAGSTFGFKWSKEQKQRQSEILIGQERTEKSIQLQKETYYKLPVQTCIHCNYQSRNGSVMKRLHGDSCKQNPNYIPKEKKPDTRELQTCEFCGYQSKDSERMNKNHFENCRQNPNYTLSKGSIWSQSLEICPHCGFQGGVGNMKRYHFENCRFKQKIA